MRRLYQLFFDKLPVRYVIPDAELLYLSTSERAHLAKVRRTAWIWSAVFCLVGYILLFVPYYLWREILFPKQTLHLFGLTIERSFTFLCYGWVLGFMEVWCLIFLNVWCVHEIAVVTGYMNEMNKKIRKKPLMEISMEKKNKEITKYGINPLDGLPKFSLFLFNTWLLIRGLLASMLIRVVVQKILGNYAFRVLLDFSGFPLFAWLNIRGTDKVYKMSLVVFMGQNLVEDILRRFQRIPPLTPDEKELVYDTLQYIAVSKRDFHSNHYYLTKRVMGHFNIPVKEKISLPEDFEMKLQNAPDHVRRVCVMLIIAGFLLDGTVSFRERMKAKRLNELGLSTITFDELKAYKKSFLNGDGLKTAIDAIMVAV